MTKCSLDMYGPSGTIQKLDGLCVLPINVLNEKVKIKFEFDAKTTFDIVFVCRFSSSCGCGCCRWPSPRCWSRSSGSTLLSARPTGGSRSLTLISVAPFPVAQKGGSLLKMAMFEEDI
jgi:hypothetical protein